MESKHTKIITTPLLFTPGPTPSPEFIRNAMAIPTLHHRTPEFESIFSTARARLLKMLEMPEVLMLASSGTGAMEAAIANFSTKKILTINSGKFGERFGAIGRALGREVVEIINEWDTPVSVDSILQNLDSNVECVCFQICESAGGLSHPYKEIAKALKERSPHTFVIADAITAMGVERLDVSHIDVLIGGSQKAFMLPPGLAILGLSSYSVKHIESNSCGYYFNLGKELKNQRKNTTAYTAPTSIIIGLKAYFDMLESTGFNMDDIYHYTAKVATATRKSLESLGLKIYPKTPSNSMSVVIAEYAKDVAKILKNDFKINLAGGQDRLKDRIFRINHMGYIPLHEISFVLNAIELALDKLSIRKFDSSANRTFFESLI
ncbi:aminotransferase class V-fold PLP-dependent enzyme [Helicobacter saguini]|uniref:Alanine--glyoxylate aminotransferase family protein n=1 Tax=Helicobacter saguini TaxID=1548018 RepID=A0A347W458_9HELI|nr:alanine--glyoxylate aminotransferase family protein [Helicobacter saguini]MWV61976.1 aminotransferase class V-fold PLP-dependent enzyme [Helicobacter saguini]MWV67349.1 aminotransferase class V-fold PLP-dependent enzyme [Helicobacter saguini]MWV69702.1 aminotransferase class V-fold PLP-dependent enzyme [Helicobacter saguini]MWV73081.1 aminotransferase class V-fold PLP-dependent enzyme [Helicobacter saguini]TLD95549.1 alanine--glyoxylate aminotransferase family protein [Helicobacter saguini]